MSEPMDPMALFGVTAGDIAADPWKWEVLRTAAVPRLKIEAPWLGVLLLGMAAVWVRRRRDPAVARRVLVGCAGLLLTRLVVVLHIWIWTVVDPDPTAPTLPFRRWPVGTKEDGRWLAAYGLLALAQAGFLWVIVSAVVSGRGRSGGGDER